MNLEKKRLSAAKKNMTEGRQHVLVQKFVTQQSKNQYFKLFVVLNTTNTLNL